MGEGMITIFALFSRYEEARDGVRDLVHKGVGLEQINAVVQDYVAKDKMGLIVGKANVEVTEIRDGLDKLVGGHRPESIRDVGVIMAAGTLAGELVSLAKSPGRASSSLRGALELLGVPAAKATSYADGIREGGVLVFVRVEEEKGSEVSSVLTGHHGQNLAGVGRRTAPV
jgi:hypothetical protein